jgi:hypothetical protein
MGILLTGKLNFFLSDVIKPEKKSRISHKKPLFKGLSAMNFFFEVWKKFEKVGQCRLDSE